MFVATDETKWIKKHPSSGATRKALKRRRLQEKQSAESDDDWTPTKGKYSFFMLLQLFMNYLECFVILCNTDLHL